jgi:hypothetical protein
LIWKAIARLADGPRPTFIKVGETHVNMAFVMTVVIQPDWKWAQVIICNGITADTADSAEIAALRDWVEGGKHE